MYKAELAIGVRLHDLKDELSIFSFPFKLYVENDTNAHVTVSSWRRIDDNMIPARGKISGAYVNSALIKTDRRALRIRRSAGASTRTVMSLKAAP